MDPVTDASRPVPPLFRQGTRPMHRGFFCVIADTASFGSEYAEPGSRACVCVCVVSLAGSGRPASRARFGAPHLSLGRFVDLLCSTLSGLGLPLSCPCVCLCCFVCWCLFVFSPLSLAFRGFQPRLSWAWCCVAPFPTLPSLIFFSFLPLRPRCLLLSVVSGPDVLGLGAV